MRLATMVLISFFCAVFSVSSFARNQGSEFIDALKKTKASSLEKGLPDKVIPEWIENTFINGKKAIWEVNDCGEGGDGRSAPVCVEVKIPQQNEYYLHINVMVGDIDRQIEGNPELWMVYFYKSEGYKTIDVIDVQTISEAIQMYKTDLVNRSKGSTPLNNLKQ